VAGEKGGVEVPSPKCRGVEEFRFEDVPIGHDQGELDAEFADPLHFGGAGLVGVADFDAMLHGPGFYGIHAELPASTGGAVGLGEDGDDFDAGVVAK
jgi:hypothetical protein